MWILIITAILLAAALISYYSGEDIGDTLCVTVCGTILLLYILAFGRFLLAIDLISIALLVCCTILMVRNRQALQGIRKALLQPYLIVSILLLAGITFCVREQIFTWWDDINFWSTDAKALYYLNGFPGKYGNVSPEFGDYPPVTSLFKWLFLQS